MIRPGHVRYDTGFISGEQDVWFVACLKAAAGHSSQASFGLSAVDNETRQKPSLCFSSQTYGSNTGHSKNTAAPPVNDTRNCCLLWESTHTYFFFFVTWWTLSFLHKIMKIIFTCNLLWPPPYSVQSNGGITDNVSERILKKNIVADRKYYTMSTLVVIQSKSSEPAPTSIIVPICRVAGGAFVFYRSSSGICRCGIAKNAVLKAIHRWIKLKTVSSRNEVLCLHGCNAVTFLDRNGIRVPWRQSNDCTLPATQHHQTRIFTPAYTHTFFTFRATSHWTVSTNLTFHKADTGGRAV